MIEPLEPRRLLAASVTVVDDVLTVTGTDGDDLIEIYTVEQRLLTDLDAPPSSTLRVEVNGVSLVPDRDAFRLGLVRRIFVNALGGDDLVALTPVTPKPETFDDGRFQIRPTGGQRTEATVEGAAGDDTIYGGGGNDRLVGGRGDDFVVGGKGDDRLSGGPGDDRLYGTDGRDRLEGGDGDDGLNVGRGGREEAAGGRGNDTIDYSDVAEDLIIQLGFPGNDGTPYYVPVPTGGPLLRPVFTFPIQRYRPPGDPTGPRSDSLTGIENAIGGSGDDLIFGDDGDNVLIGNAGDDTIWGGAGDDRLYGSAGSDLLYAYDFATFGPDPADPFTIPPQTRSTVGVDRVHGGGGGIDRAVVDDVDSLAKIDRADVLVPEVFPSE